MLVGIQNYKYYAPLESCHGDVDDMRAMLMQSGFEDDYLWVLKDELGEMVTASDLYSNVTAFARRIQKGDEVIFFFSGHGIGDKSGNNFLLGHDGNTDNPSKFSVNVDEIKTLLKEPKPSEIVLIVDACRNFVVKEGRGAGEQLKTYLNTGKGMKIKARIQKPGFQTSKRETERPRKTIVKTIYAASEGEQSFERKDKNNGAFTYYLTYLVDSPNSAMDVDMSKDGIISIEDLVMFADDRLSDFCLRSGLPVMNPVYQTDGGVQYRPFALFRYDAAEEVKERKRKQVKPIFEYDEQEELAKIKKYQEDLSYLDEELPVYRPQDFSKEEIDIKGLDATDLSSWETTLAQQEEIERKKAEEERKRRVAEEKRLLFKNLSADYNSTIKKLEATDDLFAKYDLLEQLRNRVNSAAYPSVKQKILVLLEPVYEKIKKAKQDKEREIAELEGKFEEDLTSMEKMMYSGLSAEIKEKYIATFEDKWVDCVRYLNDDALLGRYRVLLLQAGDTVTNSIGMSFVYIPPGSFTMGSYASESGRDDDEKQHKVTFTKGFYLQTTEVTQGQWKAVMGSNPSHFISCGDGCPVEKVSWEDAQEFIEKLNRMEGTDVYRLPREAEWEYACRAGSDTPFNTGNCLSTDEANYDGNYPLEGCSKGTYREKTMPVGSFSPNKWGLYDMHGNVWEWCNDWYGDYPSGSVTDAKGSSSGSRRVIRGGSWYRYAGRCRSASRNCDAPGYRSSRIGFRLARTQ